MLRFFVVLLAGLVSACGGRSAGVSDAGLRLCPAAGGEGCFLVTPTETGLRGEGADVDQWALRPAGTPSGRLLVFLNGSGGSPRAATTGQERSFYAVARDEGLHALGVSYRSSAAVGSLCRGDDACFEPTRLTQVTGALQPGAAPELANVLVDEGIEVRLAAALRTLAARDPSGGWGDFFTGDGGVDDLRWERLVVSGHSQGGGHAALLGKRHRVDRVVMLASPCDAVESGAPAAWLSSAAGWATDPATRFFGLWAEGDGTCPAAPTAWERLGLPAAARDASAAGCAGQPAHAAPLNCTENGDRWRAMLR